MAGILNESEMTPSKVGDIPVCNINGESLPRHEVEDPNITLFISEGVEEGVRAEMAELLGRLESLERIKSIGEVSNHSAISGYYSILRYPWWIDGGASVNRVDHENGMLEVHYRRSASEPPFAIVMIVDIECQTRLRGLKNRVPATSLVLLSMMER